MPESALIYFSFDVDKRIVPKKPVNRSGYAYVGREFTGKMVECLILKNEGSV
ncbi:hypothetical protein GQ473_05670 [archaeon]|nr:hypothetical protein [archaeon]